MRKQRMHDVLQESSFLILLPYAALLLGLPIAANAHRWSKSKTPQQNPVALATEIHRIVKGSSGGKGTIKVTLDNVVRAHPNLALDRISFIKSLLRKRNEKIEQKDPYHPQERTVVQDSSGDDPWPGTTDQQIEKVSKVLFDFMKNGHEERQGDDINKLVLSIDGMKEFWQWDSELNGDNIGVMLTRYPNKQAFDELVTNNPRNLTESQQKWVHQHSAFWSYKRDGSFNFYPVLLTN